MRLLKVLVQRDLASSYKGSILGNFWPLIQQLAQLLIYTYVFSVVLKVKLPPQNVTDANPNLSFGIWLFAGLLPWLTHTTILAVSSSVVLRNQNLVTKVVFPLTLLPLVPVFSAFLESTFGLVLVIAAVAVFAKSIHLTLLLLPLVWVVQLLLGAGLAYLLSSLTVFLRDIPQVLSVIILVWFYATPILYPIELIPQPFQEWVLWFNPMASITAMYRDLILVGKVNHWPYFAVAFVLSSGVFLIGLWCYRKLQSAFADVL